MRKEEFFEILGELDENIIEEAYVPASCIARRRGGSSGWLKRVSAAACLCLIFTAAALTLPYILKDDGSKDDGSVVLPLTSANIIINWDSVFINEAAGTSPDYSLICPDPSLYTEERWGEEEIIDYYGWDLTPDYIPEGLSDGGKTVSAGIVRWKATGKIVQEQAGRSFWTDFGEDGSPRSDDDIVIPTGFSIAASKLNILHCALLPVDESKATDFGGVPVTISHCSLPYGPFDPTQKAPNGLYNMPAGYYDIYTASFSLAGVNYEIETKRLESEELIKIVASVISAINSQPEGDFIVGSK